MCSKMYIYGLRDAVKLKKNSKNLIKIRISQTPPTNLPIHFLGETCTTTKNNTKNNKKTQHFQEKKIKFGACPTHFRVFLDFLIFSTRQNPLAAQRLICLIIVRLVISRGKTTKIMHGIYLFMGKNGS